MNNVAPILSPSKELMIRHLQFLFGRALTGRIEVTAIHTDKSAEPRPRTRFFDLEEIESAADFASEINSQPNWNVYVGAALRKPGTFPGRAADDDDFLATFALWADADDETQLTSARACYDPLGAAPPFVVVTGRTPTKRAQLWWPLDTQITELDALRGALRGIALALGTDPKVCTGKQLMRLAGGLAWPKLNKPGRALEPVEIIEPTRAARAFPIEQISRAFPPVAVVPAGTGMADITVEPSGALGLDEKITDGREAYAFRLIRATLREWIGETGAEPTPAELLGEVAPRYYRRIDVSRPGRDPGWLLAKCREAVDAFRRGMIPGMRSLDEAVATWATRKPEEEEPDADGEPEEPEQSRPFQASDFTGDPPERRWIVPEWIVEGAVNSLYGDGGLGKTLLAQQLACSAAIGAPWLGLPTTQGSVLAVLCEDDVGELHRRHYAIKASMGHTIGNPFSKVWLWPRVGEDSQLVRWDRNGLPALTPFAAWLTKMVEECAPTLLILDTLADFYGGDEIARTQVNYFIKVVLGRLIKERTAAGCALTVLLLGHPSVGGKADGRGFSGSTAWNAAVRSRMYLTRPEDGAGDERVLTRGKANYASSGDETALRLFYKDGALHALEDAGDGDSMLWAAKQEVVRLVSAAWRTGSPFTGQKTHRRYVYGVLPEEMQRQGFGPQITRQAVRQAIEDGDIWLSRSNGKSGFTGSK